MPEEMEVPTEHLREALEHKVHDAEAHVRSELEARWTSMAALSAALLAVLAAVSALLAGHHANEAMLEQIRASDGYAFYQAKGIKASVLQAKIDLLSALGKDVRPSDRSDVERYRKEQEEIKAEADKDAASSATHMARHGVMARSVTLFQIAIAVAATSMLTKKRPLWYLGLMLGLAGTGFLIQSIL